MISNISHPILLNAIHIEFYVFLKKITIAQQLCNLCFVSLV